MRWSIISIVIFNFFTTVLSGQEQKANRIGWDLGVHTGVFRTPENIGVAMSGKLGMTIDTKKFVELEFHKPLLLYAKSLYKMDATYGFKIDAGKNNLLLYSGVSYCWGDYSFVDKNSFFGVPLKMAFELPRGEHMLTRFQLSMYMTENGQMYIFSFGRHITNYKTKFKGDRSSLLW